MPLLDILKRFKGQRVLVIGDLILDRYIWGKVTRISPEAPVPVVDVTGDSYRLGGAANVANNIAALGGEATVVGVVGQDHAAETMETILRDQRIRYLAVEDKRPTTIKTRVVAHSQHVVRFDQEAKEKIGGRALKGLIGIVNDTIGEHDAVVVSDYRKGVVTPDLMKALARAVRGGKFVAVDPKVGHFHLYKGMSIITPNLLEASQGADIEITDDYTLVAAGKRLRSRLSLGAVLITRGEEGMSLFEEGSVVQIPTLARKVYDVTGAGDTVIAALSIAHAAGATLEQAAIIANHAAGVVVAEVGTATATPAKLRQSIRSAKLEVVRL